MSMLATVVATTLVAFCQTSNAQVRPDSARLHRIHLRNGDYVEGRLHSETSIDVEVRFDDGILILPRSQITRIEPVLLRTHTSPPPPRPSASGAPRAGPKYVIVVPSSIVQSVRFRVDAVLDAFRKGTIDRDDATRRILECGPEGALHLADQLESMESAQRGFAAQCLTLLKNPGTLSTLVRLLDSEDPFLRVLAAELSGQLGEEGAGRRLRALLKDRVPAVRAAAVAALERLDDPGSLEFIGPLCGDPDPEARGAALDATLRLAQRHEMRENLLWALDRAMRWPPQGGAADILKAIGATGDPEAWTMVVSHLAAPAPKTRAAAALAVGMLGAPQAAKAVQDQMEVELAAEPRIQLAIAAERLKIEAAGKVLIDWLSEPDESVRRAALRSLRSLSGLNHGEDPAAWRAWWAER